MRKGNFLLVIQWRDAIYKSFQLLSGSLWNDPQIKFCSLLSCHKVAKNVLQAHNRRVLEINASTSNSLSATQHMARKRPDLLHRKLCMSYLYGAKFRKCFYQVHFNHDSPGIVWAWLWFVAGFFNRRRSHCAHPTPCEGQSCCGPQRCDWGTWWPPACKAIAVSVHQLHGFTQTVAEMSDSHSISTYTACWIHRLKC